MATPRKTIVPKVHAEDRDHRRRKMICAKFQAGQTPGEIASELRLKREVVVGVIARAGLSRGEMPAALRRFSWEDQAATT